jgi:peptidoglycan/LPS O-acetylase OafA/YrhL
MVTLYGAEYWHSHAVPGQLLLFVLAIPTTVGVASVSYRFIEKPGIAAGKMFTSRMLAREKVVSFATPSPTRTKRPGESQTQFLAPSHSDLQS